MPAPFSQGWIGNIRTLAAAHWWDGTSVYRVQDNYVAQWGDADGEDKANAKPLPEGLAAVPESEYVVHLNIEPLTEDRKSVGSGTSGSVSVDFGGRVNIKKKKRKQ